MQLFFVLAALLVLATAQCNVEGRTFMAGDHWITFGTATGEDDFIPAYMSMGGDSSVYTAMWKMAANQNVENTLWEVREIGATSEMMCGPSKPAGIYQVTFDDSCVAITFSVESDFLCEARQGFLGAEFGRTQFSECGAPGSDITGRFSESDAAAELSSDAVDITFGPDGYVIMSVSDKVAFFQHWTMLGTDATIMDIMSYPDGHACDSDVLGQYTLDWETASCGLRACGIADSCLERAQLFHDSTYNAYAGATCPDQFVDASPPDMFGECSDGTQWTEPSTACTDQSTSIVGGCVYCGGRVGSHDVHVCVARKGVRCNTLREQISVFTFCNLDFECAPASVVTVSVLALFACLLALLF